MAIITSDLRRYLRRTFLLDWRDIHGAPHWARVRENGLRLAEKTGADCAVIELFAFLHDCRARRRNHHLGLRAQHSLSRTPSTP